VKRQRTDPWQGIDRVKQGLEAVIKKLSSK